MSTEQPEDVTRIVEELGKAAEDIGLYLQSYGLAVSAEQKALLAVSFIMGEQAFSDRVLNPHKHQENRSFQALARSEELTEADIIKRRMKKNIAEGRDPFDDGEE